MSSAILFVSFFSALILCLAFIPIAKQVSHKYGIVAYPRKDRWHKTATPLMGGAAIFGAFVLTILFSTAIMGEWHFVNWGMLAGSMIVFGLGLYDDYRPMTPQAKLIGQIIAAAMVILQGYTTDFFSPRLDNQVIAELPNILLTFFWLVGITNAINLLDNMDGLAGGIALITAGFLGYFFWQSGDVTLLIISLSLAGSILGFLINNFPPASVFMGDSGSLFLGFTLALLAIARQPQASNVFAVMGVPTLLFLLPILDTALVTFTRLLSGKSPAEGGRDHTSHRLIAFGLNERQALFVLYAIAILSGVMAAALESIGYFLSLILVPLMIITLALFTAYLGRLKFVSPSKELTNERAFTRLVLDLTLRRRLLEVILDFFLIGLAYFLAFLLYYGVSMNDEGLTQFLQTLPIALGSAYLSFFILGIYRGVWRYVGINDLVRYFLAALGSYIILVAALFTLDSMGLTAGGQPFAPLIPFTFGICLFAGLAASRSSFKLLDSFSAQRIQNRQAGVLIYGAGDTGEMALRWIMMNPEMAYKPIGFLDDDPYLHGRQIHGVQVLGGGERFEELLDNQEIGGVILAGVDPCSQAGQNALESCEKCGKWTKTFSLDFEDVSRRLPEN